MEHVTLNNTQNLKENFGNEDSDRNQKLYRSISHTIPTAVYNVDIGD